MIQCTIDSSLDMWNEGSMSEFISIMEAARRAGVSDKTIRRAIHAGKLAARYPKRNLAEIAVSDLAAWRALAEDVQEQRLVSMEQRLQDLERQVEQLTAQVSEQARVIERLTISSPVRASSPRQPVAPAESGILPIGLVLLQDFSDVHSVSRNEAERRYKTGMIAGQKRPWAGYKREVIALGPRGRRDFWVQFHETQGFQACDDCPHTEEK